MAGGSSSATPRPSSPPGGPNTPQMPATPASMASRAPRSLEDDQPRTPLPWPVYTAAPPAPPPPSSSSTPAYLLTIVLTVLLALLSKAHLDLLESARVNHGAAEPPASVAVALQAHESRVSTLERSAEVRLRDLGEKQSSATEERLASTIRSYDERFDELMRELSAKRHEDEAASLAAAGGALSALGAEACSEAARECPACPASPTCPTAPATCLGDVRLIGSGAIAAKWVVRESERPEASRPVGVDEVRRDAWAFLEPSMRLP